MYSKISKLFTLTFCIIFFSFAFLEPAYALNDYFGSPNDRVIQSKTWSYWDELHNTSTVNYDCPEKDLKLCVDNTVNVCTNTIYQIRNIPVMYVDEDLLLFSSYLIDFYSQGARAFKRMQIYLDDINYFNSFTNQANTVMEVFFRVLSLDFDVYKDINKKTDKYELERAETISEINEWTNKALEVESEEQRIRKILSHRYHKELPALNNMF